jgi:hypothetical protein
MTSLMIGGVPHPEKFLDIVPGGHGVTGCDPAIAAPQREFASPLLRAPVRDGYGDSAGTLSGYEVKVAILPRTGIRKPEERCIVLPLQRGRPRFFLQHRFKPRT